MMKMPAPKKKAGKKKEKPKVSGFLRRLWPESRFLWGMFEEKRGLSRHLLASLIN
jgi:hypothetical protein